MSLTSECLRRHNNVGPAVPDGTRGCPAEPDLLGCAVPGQKASDTDHSLPKIWMASTSDFVAGFSPRPLSIECAKTDIQFPRAPKVLEELAT